METFGHSIAPVDDADVTRRQACEPSRDEGRRITTAATVRKMREAPRRRASGLVAFDGTPPGNGGPTSRRGTHPTADPPIVVLTTGGDDVGRTAGRAERTTLAMFHSPFPPARLGVPS